MVIGLFGYGKMGRAIETLALEQGIDIAWKIDRALGLPDPVQLREADVALEFTRPEAAFQNVMALLEAGVPVVSGTTGWQEHLEEAQKRAVQLGGAFLWASNFSVGVNLLFAVNRYLARLMNHRPEYKPGLSEVHHVHKLDAPSGTALTLAHDLLDALDSHSGWAMHPHPADTDIPVQASREGEVPGIHTITWKSAVDTLTLRHEAHSRTGFASGALLAAQWIEGRQGVFSMADVLGIQP